MLILHLGIFLNGTGITTYERTFLNQYSVITMAQHNDFCALNIGYDYPLRIVKGILWTFTYMHSHARTHARMHAHIHLHTHTHKYCIGYYIGLLF